MLTPKPMTSFRKSNAGRFKNNEEFEQATDTTHETVLAKLLESRILFLSGDLNEEKSKDVVSKLITLDYQNPRKDILFYIDSYGGDIHSLIAIHDAMQMVRCDVATICIGKAMSAAALLLIAGKPGKRFVTPNSRIMMHELATGDEGKLSYMKDTLIEAEKLQSLLEGFVRDYTKMTPKQVKQCFSKDFYMDAKFAKKLGVVDFIITHPDVLHKEVNI